MLKRPHVWSSLAIALMIWAPCALAHRDRIEKPASVSEEPGGITLTFADGSRVVLHRHAAQPVEAITIYLGTVRYSVPEDICARLSKVHPETLRLLWDGNALTPQESPYFYVRFNAGSEEEKTFGDFPEISLIFRDGVPSDAQIKRKISEDSWQISDLKNGSALGLERILK